MEAARADGPENSVARMSPTSPPECDATDAVAHQDDMLVEEAERPDAAPEGATDESPQTGGPADGPGRCVHDPAPRTPLRGRADSDRMNGTGTSAWDATGAKTTPTAERAGQTGPGMTGAKAGGGGSAGFQTGGMIIHLSDPGRLLAAWTQGLSTA